MLTRTGPKVVEFNCRFGDPETQVIIPLFEGDLLETLTDVARGSLRVNTVQVPQGAAACVVLASGGYPDSYPAGMEIHGLERAGDIQDCVVFHAGTRLDGPVVRTSGGRVLGVTAFSGKSPLITVLDNAYKAVRCISFEGMHYRTDIGKKALTH
jgi:phosphoribosylamine--glycine ligase